MNEKWMNGDRVTVIGLGCLAWLHLELRIRVLSLTNGNYLNM